MIAVICLSAVVVILVGSLVFTLIKVSKNMKNVKRTNEESIGTASSIISQNNGDLRGWFTFTNPYYSDILFMPFISINYYESRKQ